VGLHLDHRPPGQRAGVDAAAHPPHQLAARIGAVAGEHAAGHDRDATFVTEATPPCVSTGMERAFRDVRAGTFHPLTPEKTLTYAGKVALGDPGATQ
jgi:hypothetical protein